MRENTIDKLEKTLDSRVQELAFDIVRAESERRAYQDILAILHGLKQDEAKSEVQG